MTTRLAIMKEPLISLSTPRTFTLLEVRVIERVSLLIFLASLFGGCSAQDDVNPGLIVTATFIGLEGTCTITCTGIICCVNFHIKCKRDVSFRREYSTYWLIRLL